MTSEETAEFWKQCWIQFPTLKQWLKDNSPDMPATLAIWSRALVPFTAAECLGVLYRWSCGELDPPTGYQREIFHLHVAAVIKQDRSNAYKTANKGSELQNLKGRRIMDAIPVMGPFLEKVMALKARCDIEEISEEEFKQQVQSLVDEAHRKIDSQKYYKAS